MKRYERESFFKTFVIFFVLLEILLGIDYWYAYQKVREDTKKAMLLQMRLCAFSMECDGMQTDFLREKGKESQKNILFERDDFYAYFEIPAKRFLMKVVYPKERYEAIVSRKASALLAKFAINSFFAFLVSVLFAWYALRPFRRALVLNEEFVRDILHDFNTPLSSIRVNAGLLKRKCGDDDVRIARIDNSIETILGLQSNLRMFLKEIPTQQELFDIASVLTERIEHFRMMYPNIRFDQSLPPIKLRTNKDAFVRIVDNLVSNAAKYNMPGGSVKITMQGSVLIVEDTGKGIADPSKVFDRYYKEQEQGIGIGLHVVKKLCEEIGIDIAIQSRLGEGTRISLDIKYVMID